MASTGKIKPSSGTALHSLHGTGTSTMYTHVWAGLPVTAFTFPRRHHSTVDSNHLFFLFEPFSVPLCR